MAMVAHELQPEEVWITGGARGAVCREIKKRLPGTPVYSLGSEKEVPLDRTGSDTVIFAAGNLAGPGRSLIERVVGEGKRIVPVSYTHLLRRGSSRAAHRVDPQTINFKKAQKEVQNRKDVYKRQGGYKII